jgi:hypothetical protein
VSHLILACIFAISAQHPEGTTKTLRLTAEQAQTYQRLDSLNVITSEQSFTEYEQDYLFGLCSNAFHLNPDLSYLKTTGAETALNEWRTK